MTPGPLFIISKRPKSINTVWLFVLIEIIHIEIGVYDFYRAAASCHQKFRECVRNPHFRIFAYLMAVILSVTLLLIFSIFWTKQFFWGMG